MDKIELSDRKYLLKDANQEKQFYGDTNLCWAYSTINASEASILKHKIGSKDTLRFNPKALAYRKYVRNADPLGNNAQYIDKNQGNWLYNSGAISQTPSLLSM